MCLCISSRVTSEPCTVWSSLWVELTQAEDDDRKRKCKEMKWRFSRGVERMRPRFCLQQTEIREMSLACWQVRVWEKCKENSVRKFQPNCIWIWTQILCMLFCSVLFFVTLELIELHEQVISCLILRYTSLPLNKLLSDQDHTSFLRKIQSVLASWNMGVSVLLGMKCKRVCTISLPA